MNSFLHISVQRIAFRFQEQWCRPCSMQAQNRLQHCVVILQFVPTWAALSLYVVIKSDLFASLRVSIVPNDPPRHDLNSVTLYLHRDVATQFPYLTTTSIQISSNPSRWHVSIIIWWIQEKICHKSQMHKPKWMPLTKLSDLYRNGQGSNLNQVAGYPGCFDVCFCLPRRMQRKHLQMRHDPALQSS